MIYSFTKSERGLFTTLLADQFGLQFEEHRHRVLDAALSRRMQECGIHSAVAFARRLDDDHAELDCLVDLVTNNLSRFYRNPDQLRAITEWVVPELGKRTGADGTSGSEADRPLNIWVAGCATGEEPYSLAMALKEHLPRSSGFRITATDISGRALDVARQGSYPATALRGVPDAVLSRHFCEEEGRLRVVEPIRRLVSFVRHNLIEPPPVGGADLVLCRNVLTYLTPAARLRAVARMRESISDAGFLFIGNSETLPRRSGFNSTRFHATRFYRRSCRPPE